MTDALAHAHSDDKGWSFRNASEADRAFISDMFRQTDTWGEPGRDVSEHYQDDLVRYVDMWSEDQGGIIAEINGEDAGAAWLRLFEEDEPGSGFVSEDIPEVAIALRQDAIGYGLGTALLKEALLLAHRSGHHAVSLAVEFGNERARRLYAKIGFTDQGIDPHEECHVMVYRF